MDLGQPKSVTHTTFLVALFCRLSGLSPFMGDDDNETIQNVSSAEWDFEDEAFDVVSDMSKTFIEELLIRGPE